MYIQRRINHLKEYVVKFGLHGILLEYKRDLPSYRVSPPILKRINRLLEFLSYQLYYYGFFSLPHTKYYAILVEIIGPYNELNYFVFDSLILGRSRIQAKYYSRYLKDFYAHIDNIKIKKLIDDLDKINFYDNLLEWCKFSILYTKDREDLYKPIIDIGVLMISNNKNFYTMLVDIIGEYNTEFIRMIFHKLIIKRFTKLTGRILQDNYQEMYLKTFFASIGKTYKKVV